MTEPIGPTEPAARIEPTPHSDAPRADDREPTFADSLTAALGRSGYAQLKPGETPTAGAMLGVLGGVRGIIESVLPGFAFLLLFTITKNLAVSVLVPVAIAVIFVVVRAATRTAITGALAGAVGIALTAVLTLVTNRAENNFLPGIVINSGLLIALVVSILVRWPLVGIVVGLLMGDGFDWRADAAKRRALTLATWVWVIPSAIRVAIQVPLYIAGNSELLAASKLLTGIPLYVGALWVTWLLVRAVYTHPAPAAATDPK